MAKNSLPAISGLKAQPPYPWLAQVWTAFTRQVEQNRLPHALLLVGPDGVGCVDLSIAMAQYLLCIDVRGEQSCGQCKSCLLMQSNNHPDLHVVTLELNPKTKKTAQAIKVQQIREVADSTANTAQQGGRKLIVIHPAEAMNSNAANALLKNLEEPSGDCVFILVSEQPAFLAATIRSRCSRVVIALPSKELSLGWLERNQISDAERCLSDVGGRPLKVLEWLEKDLWGQQKQLGEHLQKLLNGQQSFLECAKTIIPYGPIWLLEQLQSGLIITLSRVFNEVEEGGSDSWGPLTDTLMGHPPHKLFKLYDGIMDKKKWLLSGANPNPQLVIEEVLMQIQELAAK